MNWQCCALGGGGGGGGESELNVIGKMNKTKLK